jgi:hypothetical protein
MPFKFDRSQYRIPYPPSARARLLLGSREVPLVDCSERGIRYMVGAAEVPDIGTRITGTVRLLSGGPAHLVSGKVVRCTAGEVAVELEAPGIPLQAVFAEQRYLNRRFAARIDPSPGDGRSRDGA